MAGHGEQTAADAPPPGEPAGAPERRRYESPLRRAQAAQTRERIVAAGAELVHERPRWDWRDLTVRAVARRAGVNERTVYRHFASERDLHDAVVRRLEEEAGEPLTGLDLDRLPEVTARLFSYLSSFALPAESADTPALAEVDARRREALRAAVEQAPPEWSEADREMAAAMLDLLWTISSYSRLTTVWKLDPHDASRAVAGLVRLLVDAIREGRRPWSAGDGAG